jgi:hypothetical protein
VSAAIPGYNTRQTVGGTPYVDLSGASTPIQWRLYERHTNQLTMSVREIIDDARTQHWSFAEVQLGDGAAVRWINNRQRRLLLQFRDGLKGVVTLTVRTTATPNVAPGNRIGITPKGTPYLLDKPGDGYAVYLTDARKAPYFDASGVPITDTPLDDGWPLPIEVLSVTAAKGIASDATMQPIDVRTENERSTGRPGRRLTAFASGNRIAPLRRSDSAFVSEFWNSVSFMELSYIAIARVTDLCCLVELPAVLAEALIAGLCEYLANQSKSCTPQERAQFAGTARRAELQLRDASSDILGEAATRSVTFKG